MDQTLSERKRMIVQRSAETRAAIKQNLVATAEVVRDVCERLKGPRPYVRAGLVLSGGMIGLLLGKRLMQAALSGHRECPGYPASNGGTGISHALGWLLIQVISSLLLPYIREHLHTRDLSDSLKRLHPSRIFFRWLGLEK